MSNQPVIRSHREAKVYAIAVIAAFIVVPVLVIVAFAAPGAFWFFIILAVIVAVVATRYSRHLTAYTRHQKENQ